MADETPGTEQPGDSEDDAAGATPTADAQAGTPEGAAGRGEGVPADMTPAAEATIQRGGGGRFEELMAKRQSSGLTDPEAEELGRLIAEREGKPHSSAQSLKRGPEGEQQGE